MQVTAKDKFQCVVWCLVEFDTVIGCEYGWYGRNCGVCVVGKMHVGMVIHESSCCVSGQFSTV